MSAQLQIVEVSSVSEAEELAAFFKTVWTGDDEVAPFDLMLAVIHVGGYAAMIRDGQTPVAGSFGFIGQYAAHNVLHSHVTASTKAGAGYALKQHQFEWAREQGLAGITWTFDPLVRRNCVFNFEKLGAFAVEYLPNFYGTMTDSINQGDDSDRLFAYWPVAESVEVDSVKTEAVALRNANGAPQKLDYDASQAFWIELPEDIEQLRKSDLATARQWRKSVREALLPALENGWFIRSVNSDRTAILVEPSTSDYEFQEDE